jgi:hypothetical protein
MAVYYVYSGAAGTNNGSSWANAFTTLTTAFATEVAGDTLYVAHDHAESTAGVVTLTSSGTTSLPTRIVCVNRAGSVPPVSADRRATATVATSGANNLTITGCGHFDGIIFIAGSTTGGANFILTTVNNQVLRFDNCSLQLGNTGAGTLFIGGSAGSLGGTYIELNNTTMSFAAVSHGITVVNGLKWRNTPSALLGTIPTNLITPVSSRGGSVDCAGVDFSAAGSGKTIAVTSGAAQDFAWRFLDCKLNAAVTKALAQPGFGANEVDFIRSGSAGVNYTVYRLAMAGSLVEETTIVRTGGASDGTTSIAWRIDTNTFANYSTPFECPPIVIWNDVVGSGVTATVEGIWGGGAVPNDNDIWVDVEYLGSSSSPQASFVNDGTADLLATAAGQTSSAATWGGSTTKFKLNVSFTPQQKGWIYARVKCAKASSTFYIDPLVTLT